VRCGQDGRIQVRRRQFARGFAVEAVEPGVAFRVPVRIARIPFV
jgi:hypothetical protein